MMIKKTYIYKIYSTGLQNSNDECASGLNLLELPSEYFFQEESIHTTLAPY